jgi:uncharacterized membrane protein SirB2
MLNHRLAWHYQMRRHRTRVWVCVKDTATDTLVLIAAIGIFVWGVWS